MSAKKFRPARAEPVYIQPRPPRRDCTHMRVDAREGEDRAQVVERVAGYDWAPRIVGSPQRVGQRWVFDVRRVA